MDYFEYNIDSRIPTTKYESLKNIKLEIKTEIEETKARKANDMNNKFNRLYNGGSKKKEIFKQYEPIVKEVNPRALLLRPNTKKIVFTGESQKENLVIYKKDSFSIRSSTSVSRRKHNKLARPDLGPTKIPLMKMNTSKNNDKGFALPSINSSNKQFRVSTRNGAKNKSKLVRKQVAKKGSSALIGR